MRLDEPTLILLGAAGWATVEGWAHLAESDVTPAVRWAEAVVMFVLPASIALWVGPQTGYSPAVNEAMVMIAPWLLAMGCLGRRFFSLAAGASDSRVIRALPRVGGNLFGWAGVALIFTASAASTVSCWAGAWHALPLMLPLALAGLGVATSFGDIELRQNSLLVGHAGLHAAIEQRDLRGHEWLRDERGPRLRLWLPGRREMVIRCTEEWAADPEVRAWFEGA